MRIKLMILIAAVNLLFCSIGYAEDVITDTSFEYYDVSTVTLDNGNVKISYQDTMPLYEGVKDLCSISVAEGVSHTGNRSLLLDFYKDNKPGFKFKVKPNKLYVFSAFMKIHPDTDNASYSLYSDAYNYGYIFPFEVPAKISHMAYISYAMPQQGKEYSTPIARAGWTEFKRYIYVNSDTCELDLKFFDYATQRFKFYIDDVTLTPIEDDCFKAVWSSGANSINSIEACDDIYSAEFTLMDRPLFCYCYDSEKMKVLPKNQTVEYSLDNIYEGIDINSETGKLTVSAGAETEIEITARIKLGDADTRYENVKPIEEVITKRVSIAPYDRPTVTSVGSEIEDFSPDTLNYYGIRCEESPVLEVTSDSSLTVESMDGVLSGVRLTAAKNGSEKIYNFYTTNPWKNILKDGGFENGSSLEEFVTPSGSMNISDFAHTGKYGLEFTAAPYNGIYSDLTFKPNRLYIYSAWVKAKENSESKSLKFISVRAGTPIVFNFSPNFIENYMYDKVNVSDSEWTQIVRTFYVTQEATVRVGLQNGGAKGTLFEGYIDDVYIAELNTGDAGETIKAATIDSVVKNEDAQDKTHTGKITGSFAFLNYQNKIGENQSANVLVKGKQANQKLAVIISEYDENEKLISDTAKEIVSDGVFLINAPQKGHKQKIFFWDMNGLKPVTEALNK